MNSKQVRAFISEIGKRYGIDNEALKSIASEIKKYKELEVSDFEDCVSVSEGELIIPFLTRREGNAVKYTSKAMYSVLRLIKKWPFQYFALDGHRLVHTEVPRGLPACMDMVVSICICMHVCICIYVNIYTSILLHYMFSITCIDA